MVSSTQASTRVVEGPALEPFRPVRPDRTPARWIRALTGVREDLLAWVPEERARYSRLGAIIINTGLMAAVSLLVALQTFLEVPWYVLALIAGFWGWLILTVDGWLVASTHGMLGASRYRVFLPRLLLSVLLGLAIAEPLLMLVFRPAIDQEVKDHRRQTVEVYRSVLTECNPPNGQFISSTRCTDYHLPATGAAAGLQAELTTLTKERNGLQAQVQRDQKTLDAKEATARIECNGTRGAGLTGKLGVGPSCRQNRREASRFARDSRLPQRRRRLDELERQINRVNHDLEGSLATTGRGVKGAIEAAVTRKEDAQEAIGLLEQESALERLSARSSFVHAGQWLLRSLLVAVDCLPVLAKMLGGTTSYDRLLNRQLQADDDLHNLDARLQQRVDSADKEVRMAQIDRRVRHSLEDLDEADRARKAHRDAELDARIDALAKRLRRESGDASA